MWYFVKDHNQLFINGANNVYNNCPQIVVNQYPFIFLLIHSIYMRVYIVNLFAQGRISRIAAFLYFNILTNLRLHKVK